MFIYAKLFDANKTNRLSLLTYNILILTNAITVQTSTILIDCVLTFVATLLDLMSVCWIQTRSLCPVNRVMMMKTKTAIVMV